METRRGMEKWPKTADGAMITFKTLISIFLVLRERGWMAGGSKKREDSKQQPTFLVSDDVILLAVTVRAVGVLSFRSDTRIRILL